MAKTIETPKVVIAVDEQKDIPVIIQNPEQVASATATKGQGTTLAPTTTEAQDAVSEGQRNINLLWETTQSRVAQAVVYSGMIINSGVIVLVIVLNNEITVVQVALISVCLQFINLTTGIVVGFYFSRINHNLTGGVGAKPPEPPYTGR